jgi:hypothetical protein
MAAENLTAAEWEEQNRAQIVRGLREKSDRFNRVNTAADTPVVEAEPKTLAERLARAAKPAPVVKSTEPTQLQKDVEPMLVRAAKLVSQFHDARMAYAKKAADVVAAVPIVVLANGIKYDSLQRVIETIAPTPEPPASAMTVDVSGSVYEGLTPPQVERLKRDLATSFAGHTPFAVNRFAVTEYVGAARQLHEVFASGTLSWIEVIVAVVKKFAAETITGWEDVDDRDASRRVKLYPTTVARYFGELLARFAVTVDSLAVLGQRMQKFEPEANAALESASQVPDMIRDTLPESAKVKPAPNQSSLVASYDPRESDYQPVVDDSVEVIPVEGGHRVVTRRARR